MFGRCSAVGVVQQHAADLQRLGTAMDQVMATMDRWERGGLHTPHQPQYNQPHNPLIRRLGPVVFGLPREYDETAAGCHHRSIFLFPFVLSLVHSHLVFVCFNSCVYTYLFPRLGLCGIIFMLLVEAFLSYSRVFIIVRSVCFFSFRV